MNKRIRQSYVDNQTAKRRRANLRAIGAIAVVFMLCGGASIASAATVPLLVPQSTAFTYLGHSCGGIQEKSYALGFDPTTGYPTGVVYLQTRCGGSGRGGGYHVTTYSAWVSATWDFAGNLLSSTLFSNSSNDIPVFMAPITDSYGDQMYNSGNQAYLFVPVPTAPASLNAVQSGDQFSVSWTLGPNVNPAAVTSSTLTATPISPPGSAVTTTIGGSATTGLIGPLQPQTAYQVTVVSTTIGGSSSASAPIAVTTVTASIPPSAPTVLAAHWAVADPTTATDTLVATWHAAVPGDSPIDQYQVTITGSDGSGTFTQTVSGTTLTANFTIDWTPNWSVKVRAHNTVGWGPWSDTVTLGGL
jgi:hypothetical protein